MPSLAVIGGGENLLLPLLPTSSLDFFQVAVGPSGTFTLLNGDPALSVLSLQHRYPANTLTHTFKLFECLQWTTKPEVPALLP